MNAKSSAAAPTVPLRPSSGLIALDRLVAAGEQKHQARRAAESDELARINRALHTLERTGGLSAAELLDQLTQTLGSAPGAAASNLLTREQEAALREAGSFIADMPPFMSRASTVTALQGISILASSLSTSEVAQMLSLSEGRIRQRATDRTLLTVRVSSSLRFPVFQFPDHRELAGWDKVAPSFPVQAHPVAVATFMSQPNVDLVMAEQAVSPTDWLASGGGSEPVINLVTTAFKVRT